MTVLGEWNINEVKGTALPQKVQTDFTAVTSEIVGAEYEPLAYLGSQIVNGINYRILALQTMIIHNAEKKLVRMIINEAPDGSVRLVSVSGVAL